MTQPSWSGRILVLATLALAVAVPTLAQGPPPLPTWDVTIEGRALLQGSPAVAEPVRIEFGNVWGLPGGFVDVLTGSDGRFSHVTRFTSSTPSYVHVTVGGEKRIAYSSSSDGLTRDYGTWQLAAFELKGRISGTPVAAGVPVDVRVVASGGQVAFETSTTTAPDGRFTVPTVLSSGTYTAEATIGVETRSQPCSPGTTDFGTWTWRLFTFTGGVTRRGDPSQGETPGVSVVDGPSGTVVNSGSAVTDADGRFSYSALLLDRTYETTIAIGSLSETRDTAVGTTDFDVFDLDLEPRLFVRSDSQAPRNTVRKINRRDIPGGDFEFTISSRYGFPGDFTLTVEPHTLMPPVEDDWEVTGFEVWIDFDTDDPGNGGWDHYRSLGPTGSTTASFDYAEPTWPATDGHVVTVKFIEYSIYGGLFPFENHVQETFPVTVLAEPHRNYTESTNPSGQGDNLTGYISPDGVLDRPLVVVEGLDATNSTFPSFYFGELGDGLSLLAANGFDIFVYDFADARRSLREHAMGVLGALGRLEAADSHSPKSPTRVLGISMGGVVSRYALAWGEENGVPHYCDMFVSADAPQQGAWMNSPFQTFLKDVDDGVGNPVVSRFVQQLQATSAKQMLVFNVYATPGNVTPDVIDGTLEYEAFYRELNEINGDGYPHGTTNIGVANARGVVDGREAVLLYPSQPQAALGQPIATLNLVGVPIESIQFQEPDLRPGSYSPVFKDPARFAGSVDVPVGIDILFWGVESFPLGYDIQLGVYGAPTFMGAHSSLDLWDVDESGSYIVGGTSKFHEIYVVPPDVGGVETTNPFHDEFPDTVATVVLGRLLDGPQLASPDIVFPDGGEVLEGGTVQRVAWTVTGEPPASWTLYVRPVGGQWRDITSELAWSGITEADWNVPCDQGEFEMRIDTEITNGPAESDVSAAPFTIASDLDGDGYSVCQGDCDDDDPTRSPLDHDLDGWSTCDGDCDDTQPYIHPGVDLDGDGYNVCEDCDESDPALNVPVDADGDGWTTCAGDCDDSRAGVYPGHAEVCSTGWDDDCDGTVNEGCGGGGKDIPHVSE